MKFVPRIVIPVVAAMLFALPPALAQTFSPNQRHEIESIIRTDSAAPFVAGEVCEALRFARDVLYVADNAGEIGFDSLVIDLLKSMGKRVTLVVKGQTYFEDATIDDARFFGLDRTADNLVKAEGFFVPSESSPEPREAVARCDLVISKGTGSYDALQGEMDGKPLVFMLKVKCGPIARRMDAREGEVKIGLG